MDIVRSQTALSRQFHLCGKRLFQWVRVGCKPTPFCIAPVRHCRWPGLGRDNIDIWIIFSSKHGAASVPAMCGMRCAAIYVLCTATVCDTSSTLPDEQRAASCATFRHIHPIWCDPAQPIPAAALRPTVLTDRGDPATRLSRPSMVADVPIANWWPAIQRSARLEAAGQDSCCSEGRPPHSLYNRPDSAETTMKQTGAHCRGWDFLRRIVRYRT